MLTVLFQRSHISNNPVVVLQQRECKKHCIYKFTWFYLRLRAEKNVDYMLLLAVFHPPPGHAVLKKLPPAYQLSSAQLRACLPFFIGLPVTFEHVGIHAAIAKLPAAARTIADVSIALELSTNAAHRVLGHVTSAFESADGGFWVSMTVDLDDKPGLAGMLYSGLVQSVSLTHVERGGRVTPLEMALVGVPARAGSRIRYATSCALKLSAYKARVVSGDILTMAGNTAMETDALTCETALSGMVPEVRKVMTEKLTYLVKCMDEQKLLLASSAEATKSAEARLAASKYAAETDNALMATQIKQLLGAMDANSKAHFGIDGDLPTSFQSENPAIVKNAALRTIMCCNQSMMLNHVGQQSSTKRARIDVPVAAAADDSAMTQSELLRRALNDTFD